MLKQSAVVPIFHEADQSKEGFCRSMAKVGVKAIELWGAEELEAWAEAAEAAGLIVASFVGHGMGDGGLNDASQHARIEEELKQSIDRAAACGVPGVIAFSGNRIDGQTDEAGLEVCVQGLGRIAGYAEDKGVNVNIELLNSRVDHKGYLADHSDWCFRVCEQVGSPRIKVLYDIYHAQIMEGDLIASMQRGLKWIGHIHTAGVPGRHDLDDTQEINYAGVFRALHEAGYDGYIGHEFWARGDKLQALRHAVDLCQTAAQA